MTDPDTHRWNRALPIVLLITALNLAACVTIVLYQRDAAKKRTAVAHARATLHHGRE